MSGITKSNKGFTVGHLNVRSLRRKVDEVSLILNNSTFDVFTVSESWLHSEIESSLLAIEGYNLLRMDRDRTNMCGNQGTKKGGGLVSYVAHEVSLNTDKIRREYRNSGLFC